MDSYTAEVAWKRPADPTARVAPHLLRQIYGAYLPCPEVIKCFVRKTQLEGHHIEHEMPVPALAVDSQVKSDSNFINLEACETLCRRVYGIRRAFSAVESRMDWQQPQGQGALKWKSKAQWGRLYEFDMWSLEADSCTIDSVEEDLRKRLEHKAQMSRWLVKGISSPEGHAPEGPRTIFVPGTRQG